MNQGIDIDTFNITRVCLLQEGAITELHDYQNFRWEQLA